MGGAVHSMQESDKRLIESYRIYKEQIYLPQKLAEKIHSRTASIIRIVNEHSLSEKTGGGRPEYWEMVFWWTRKPLVGARFVTAASLLPQNVDVKKLAKALRLLDDKLPHNLNPDLSLLEDQNAIDSIKKARLLDPFAGFGSIPLEAIRLGLEDVVAVELLPTAYVFLKAVLEYPTKYSKLRTTIPYEDARELMEIVDWLALKRKGLARDTPEGIEAPTLIVDVARWGQWITNRLREDLDIKELYDEDVAVYIGTWEIKCPGLDKYSPMIGNMWLARVRQGNRYVRLAYMQPKKTEAGDIEIEIIDLNRIQGDVSNAKLEGNKIRIAGKEYTVPEPNISPRSNTAICLQNGRQLGYIDPETGKTYLDKKHAPAVVRDRLEWYPKWAIQQWNRMLEEYLKGKISLEQLKNAPARPRLLVKVKIKGKTLEFEPATKEDNEKLWKALEKLRQLWGDPDIPTEPIPDYENRRITPILGAKYWYQFFNPRQLLTLIKLVKLIREAGKKIEQEKIQKEWSGEEAFKYTEAVTTYLAIALVRTANYNSIVTHVDATNPWGVKIAHSLAMRGIAMQWNFGETNPFVTDLPFLQIQGSWVKSLHKVVNCLSYLVSVVSGSPSRVRVLLDDATVLGRLGNERFDVIVTDPPYYDDVPYSELSDFYYVWLKRALSDVEDGRLRPRFVVDAFFRRVGGVWRERRTQWEEVARREVSVNLGRLGGVKLEDAVRWFEERLGAAFRTASGLLVDGGLLVTYYNHTSVDAWASLLRAGWEIGGLCVSAAVPLATESENRVTARNKVRLDTSIVVVWRKRVDSGKCDLAVVENDALKVAREFVRRIVEEGGVVGYDILFAGLGAALSILTKCDSVVTPKGALDAKGLAEVAYRIAGRAVAEALAGIAGAVVASAPGRFYLITRTLFAEAGDIRLDGASIGLLQVALGVNRESLVRLSILAKGRDTYSLLYPRQARTAADLEKLLRQRGLERDPGRAVLRSSVDVLHLLYYGAAKGRLRAFMETLKMRSGSMFDEALGIARVLCKLLPADDPERGLACRVVGEARGGLDMWLQKKTS